MLNRGIVNTNELKEKLVNQDQSLPAKYDHTEFRKEAEREIKRRVEDQIEKEPNMENKRRMEELCLKGTNGWLSAVPIRAHGRYLFKAEFQDALRLRLGLEPANMKTKCV